MAKKKNGCIVKILFLLVLVFLSTLGYFAYEMYQNKDKINGDNWSEVAGDVIAGGKKKLEDEIEKFDGKDWKKGLVSLKEDIGKYYEGQTKERKEEVSVEMEEIQKDKKFAAIVKEDKVLAKKLVKVKGIDTVEKAVRLDADKASEDDLMKAVLLLKTDFLTRFELYKKNKKKNADQKKIAITHAKLVKQYLRKINSINPSNAYARQNIRKVSLSIGDMNGE